MGVCTRASWCPAALLVLLTAQTAGASLMAIDLGSEFLKVALIKPGRTPISVVVNEMSKRKTPALVGLVNGERLLGEEAFSFSVRYPDTVYMRARDMLGKKADDPTIQAMLKDHNLPYKVVEHPTRGMAAVQVKGDAIHSPEELVASLLQYARQIAEAQSGAPVTDAVVAVPASLGQAGRQALLDSATLAGVNIMGLISTHTAAALQFGIERDFTNKTQHVIFYDMGSGGTEVSLIKYSSYNTKEGGATKAVSQLEVRDVDWDADLGANNLDTLLAQHFAAAFADKHKLDLQALLANPRSMAKMKKQVRRTKEMLSANTAAPISVEELHDGKDFQSSITREEFEQLAGNFFERAAAPLKRVLERSGLKVEELDYVELLGGGTRVPRLQAVLSEVLGGRTLDRHVDADEAVVLGASLFAANLSTSFRLRKFGMAEMNMYGLSLRIDEMHQAAPAAGAEHPPEEKLRNLLPYMKKLPVKRVVHLANLSADPLKVTVEYNTSSPHGLPPGVHTAELVRHEITGIEKVIKRYNTSGTINLRFEAGHDGILRLGKAEAVVEYTEMVPKLVPVKQEQNITESAKDAATPADSKEAGQAGKEEQAEGEQQKGGEEEGADSEAKADEDAAGGGTEQKQEGGEQQEAAGTTEGKPSGEGAEAKANATAEPKFETIMVPKKKLAKVALDVSSQWTVPPLAGDHLTAAKKQVAAWVAAEQAKRQTAAAKNELEAYIIRMREALHADESLRKVSSEAQRTPLLSALTDAEDWLYMEGEHEPAQAFKDKLAELRKMGDPIEDRAQEAADRPLVLGAARKEAELKASAASLWADAKPWITEEERQGVQDKVKGFLSWLDQQEAAQAKKADHEEPAFRVAQVAQEHEKLEKAFQKVANKKKPKPPPAPEGANTTEGNATTGEAGGTGAGGDDSQPKGQDKAGASGSSKSGQQAGDSAKEDSKQKKGEDAKAKKEAEAAAKKAKEAEAKAKKEAEAKAKKEAEAKAKKAKADKKKQQGDKEL